MTRRANKWCLCGIVWAVFTLALLGLAFGILNHDSRETICRVTLLAGIVLACVLAAGVNIVLSSGPGETAEQAAGEFLDAQRRRALVVTAILLVIFLIVLLTSLRW